MTRTFLFIFFVTGLLSGCWSRPSNRPNVILIAVEGLGFDAINCVQSVTEGSREFAGGFDRFCSESIRYTHAFTPSTLTQSALASILTAQYPSEHGLRHNGSQYLSEALKTLPEKAVEQGYRTAFFSGGAPIWRKSGIDQGFELFEDNMTIRYSQLFRPAGQNIELFLKWIDKDVKGEPFFSFFFLPDLQFPDTQTVSNLGVQRSLSLESQRDEIDESFDEFIIELKDRKLWDSSIVILVGTNGRISTEEDQPRGLSLKSENTQVTLMIKPARNQREESVEWSIDANVSLVDLGLTLHKWLGFEPEKRSKFEIVSLEETVLRPASGWRKSRAVISESGWSDWRRLGPVRFAIRSDHYLFLNDRQPRLFNSLIDRSESNPVVNPEIQYAPIFSNFKRLAERENWPSWQTSSPIEVEKYYLAARIFSEKEISPQNLLRISILSRNPQHGLEIMGWLARFYLERRDWDRLLDLGVEAKNQNWIYLTRRLKNLSLGTSASSCLGQLVEKKTPVSGCDDELYRKFFDYVSAGRGERAEAGERFFQSYLQRKIDEKIAVANLRNGLMWDVRIELLKEPHLVDLALWLPEFKSQKIWLDRRMSRQTIL